MVRTTLFIRIAAIACCCSLSACKGETSSRDTPPDWEPVGSALCVGEEQPVFTGCEAVAPARCWYVAKNGDDTNPGTAEAPLRRIDKGIRAAGPGDFVYVRAGVWGREQERTAAGCGDGRARYAIAVIGDVEVYGTGPDGAPCTDRWESYTVQSGTSGAYITLAAYPGETVVLDAEPDKFLDASEVVHEGDEGWPKSYPRANPITAVLVQGEKAYWRIRGFEIRGGIINIPGNVVSNPLANPNHIIIEKNTIHGVMTWGGGNPGMVRIDRGDWGGPYEIEIRCNHIYDMRANNEADWSITTDAQHYGAVTALSPEHYFGMERTGPRHLVIEGNVLHDLPHAFYFKVPMPGPVEIRHNRIFNTQALGIAATANLTFEGNLVYGTKGGFVIGSGSTVAPTIDGQNITIRGNTMVGLQSLGFCIAGTGHTIEQNFVFGATGRVAGANWDTPAIVTIGEYFHDASAVAQSVLHEFKVDQNCYVSPYEDLVIAKRLPSKEHYDLAGARSTFGFDIQSTLTVGDDPAAVFADPDHGDYTQLPGSPCINFGADMSKIPVTF